MGQVNINAVFVAWSLEPDKLNPQQLAQPQHDPYQLQPYSTISYWLQSNPTVAILMQSKLYPGRAWPKSLPMTYTWSEERNWLTIQWNMNPNQNLIRNQILSYKLWSNHQTSPRIKIQNYWMITITKNLKNRRTRGVLEPSGQIDKSPMSYTSVVQILSLCVHPVRSYGKMNLKFWKLWDLSGWCKHFGKRDTGTISMVRNSPHGDSNTGLWWDRPTLLPFDHSS